VMRLIGCRLWARVLRGAVRERSHMMRVGMDIGKSCLAIESRVLFFA
jgi:hypothetical protein